jgi:hypothetical protein
LDDGFCLVGSPSTAREALKNQVVEAGVTYVMCQLAFGDLPLAASLQTISIMRSTIIPDLTREVPAFAQNEHDDCDLSGLDELHEALQI